ncbi:MAG: hypothetical protein GF355_13785, partial [Candidatus Eisenbacteria bacterium]|nr:hypothetical protein [Candidatus Eisenbacteria bacterium]
MGVAMAATSYLFVRHADRVMGDMANENAKALRRMVELRCGVSLSDPAWNRLRGSREWRALASANRLSMTALINRMPNQVVEHFLGLLGSSLGLGMASSQAGKANGMPGAEGVGLMTGLAVFAAGLFAGDGRVFTPLMHDLARPSLSAIDEKICFHAQRLAEMPLPEETDSVEMRSLPEEGSMTTMADKG